MPKLSVIIPVYNVEQYLRECLDSIVNQTLKDIEIICVNDGSTDNSLEILREYEKKDKRIIVIDKENTGAGDSRNKGLEIAKGKYIHFMDSDDMLIEKSYERIWNSILENNYPNIIRFKAMAFSGEIDYIKDKCYECNNINDLKFNSYMSVDNDLKEIFDLAVPAWAGFINRMFLLKTGTKFPHFKVCNDRAFFIETVLQANRIYLLNLFVVKHRVNIKESLLGIRLQNFSCMFDSFNRIKKFCLYNHISVEQTKQVLVNELRDIFVFYKQSKNKNNAFEIYEQVITFLKTLDERDFLPEIKEMWYYSEFNRLYNIEISDIRNSYLDKPLHKLFLVEQIFSITNSGDKRHKVITVLGLKIKIRRRRNIQHNYY